MQQIKMVDLFTQYFRIKEEIDGAIAQVINTTSFIKGPEVTEFENQLSKYLNTKHVISCANGTDALMIALMALDLKPGDEVITPTFTFIATVETIAFLGLKPVFVDVEPGTFNIDCSKLEKLINTKTKAIIPVHLFGQCSDMHSIMKIANKYKINIIEDTAQANGSDFIFNCGTKQKAGTIGQIGCTSFFPSKNLGCFGDGGAMFTNSDELAEKIRCISNHGMKVRYYHDILGVNSRLDTIQAAVLRIKLKYLDEYNSARQKAAAFYDKALKKIEYLETPSYSSYSTHIFHQYTLKIKNGKRDQLKQFLEKNNVPTMVYYPVPLHLQKAFKYLGNKEGDFPISENLCKEVLSLPMHTELNEEQLSYICEKIISFYKN